MPFSYQLNKVRLGLFQSYQSSRLVPSFSKNTISEYAWARSTHQNQKFGRWPSLTLRSGQNSQWKLKRNQLGQPSNGCCCWGHKKTLLLERNNNILILYVHYTKCLLNIVLFLEFSKACHLSLASTRLLLIVQKKYYQPIGVTVQSHCGESFRSLTAI